MKNHYKLAQFFIFLLLTTSFAYAQDTWTKIDSENEIKPEFQISSTKGAETIISLDLNAYRFSDVKTLKGNAKIISSPDATPLLTRGAPDLPKLTKSIIIPDHDEMMVEVLSSKFITL